MARVFPSRGAHQISEREGSGTSSYLKAKALNRTIDGSGLEGASSLLPERQATTVQAWGKGWLDRREAEGVRSIGDDRSRWRVHVESAPWFRLPLAAVTRSMARDWFTGLSKKLVATPGWSRRSRRPLTARTIRNVLQLVRACFDEAVTDGHLDSNPFAALRVRKTRGASTREPWTVLRPEEQARVLAALPSPERLFVAFAMGTCLRQAEQWALRLADLNLEGSEPFMLVRNGACGPTKGGKPRRVPIFGFALEALRAWLLLLPSWAPKNPRGLVFPRKNGERRPKGLPFRAWRRISSLVGRGVRWHDLRHTGATSLLIGWWGARWRLEEVQRFCGHASITTTEMYAHWIDENEGVMSAARQMRGEGQRDMNATTTIDESGAPMGEGAEAGRLSSVVEQRFRNPEDSPPGGLTNGPESGEGETAPKKRRGRKAKAEGVHLHARKPSTPAPFVEGDTVRLISTGKLGTVTVIRPGWVAGQQSKDWLVSVDYFDGGGDIDF